MKKFVALFALAGLMLAVSPVFAEGPRSKERGSEHQRSFGAFMGKHMDIKGEAKGISKFVLVGTLKSKTDASLVVTAEAGTRLFGLKGQDVTIAVNSATKIDSNVKVGDRVQVKGTAAVSNGSVSASGTAMNMSAQVTLTATAVKLLGADEDEDDDDDIMPMRKSMAQGSVTAVTDNSITIKNSVTGETKTLTTDSDTEVKVNGEAKTLADVQVGDRGWIKFKTTVDAAIAKFISLFR